MQWYSLSHYDFRNLIDLKSLDLVLQQDCYWHYSETDLHVLQRMLDATSLGSLELCSYLLKSDPNRLENYYYLNSMVLMYLWH